jgi:hypothetical protein
VKGFGRSGKVDTMKQRGKRVTRCDRRLRWREALVKSGVGANGLENAAVQSNVDSSGQDVGRICVQEGDEEKHTKRPG